MINSHVIAVHVFSMDMLTSLSLDEIWLPRYMNWSINLNDLPLTLVEIAQMNLFKFNFEKFYFRENFTQIYDSFLLSLHLIICIFKKEKEKKKKKRKVKKKKFLHGKYLYSNQRCV